jgi:hypothetical protein
MVPRSSSTWLLGLAWPNIEALLREVMQGRCSAAMQQCLSLIWLSDNARDGQGQLSGAMRKATSLNSSGLGLAISCALGRILELKHVSNLPTIEGELGLAVRPHTAGFQADDC